MTAEHASFAAARAAFAAGRDTPRAYLERCLERIDAREPVVRAFVTLAVEAARAAADAATRRWAEGRPLSLVDGMPIGVKDLIHTADMPTEMNSPVFKGWRSGRDAASVWWLRRSGAVILGKTVTTEFGVGASGPTTNPHDPARTPGGSSSGSAAAVACGMVPVALGTQAMGSIIRPSSYCGVFGFKPSFGALNRGGIHGLIPSQAFLGTHAASLEDLWESAAVIADTAGGDAGHPGLPGGLHLPEARRPARLLVLRTREWERCDAGTRAAFEAQLDALRAGGTDLLLSGEDAEARAFEADLADWISVYMDIVCWEMRWPMAMYAEDGAELIAQRASGFLRHGMAMGRADYARALARRQGYRDAYAAFAGRVDAVVLPSAVGPAPVGLGFTGPPEFNAVSSGLGVPAVSLPMMRVEGLPVGLQLMGFQGRDDDLAAIARHVWEGRPG